MQKLIVKNKVNIIPLIDIIFLMLVFFMLATNFNKDKQIAFPLIWLRKHLKKNSSQY